MDAVVEKILQGTPFAGMGGTQERNGLIGVIRNLISEDKYTVDYILNYAQSVGYQRQMAEDVFKELTGLSPKLIINNNEYYNMPAGVPNMCIAWGISKSTKDKAYYLVPFEYGYATMETDGINAPIPTVISATIPEAFEELKKVAKGIQTLDKIITKKLLETENVQTDAHTVHQVNLPYAASPLQVLKKSFKNRVLSVSEFERQASKMLQAGELTVDEAEDLMNWKQDLIDEDESYANEVLQNNEKWNQIQATIEFEDVYNELKEIAHHDDETFNKDKVRAIFEANKDMFQEVDLIEAVNRLYQLLLGFSKEEILGHSEFNGKQASKKVTAENMTLDDIEAEDSKDQVQKEIEKIDETPVEDIFAETTPEQYLDKALQEDKVDTINDVVSKCIDKFSEKFKDFDKYQVKILSYNTKVLEDDKPVQEEMVEDKELNANAILQVILQITNNAEEANIKKVLAVFSVTNGELHWSGTVRGENDQVVAFTEEGLDALFEVEEPSEEELEDIV